MEPSYTVGGNVNWCSHCRKQYGGSSKKLKIELPYDPAIPFLVICLKKKKKHQKDICTPMFIAALFTISKIWKQPKCPPTVGWIKKMWYVCAMAYYSAIKKWKFVICNNMDGLGGYDDKWYKSDRERQILYDITNMWNLNKKTNYWI